LPFELNSLEQRKKKRYFLFLLIALILLDTAYSFYQHVAKPLDGDLIPIITYASQYQELAGEPFGWKAIQEGISYGGVNRFFVHAYLAHYFNTVPLFLQHFFSPVDSLFIASGFSKMISHVLLILLLSMMVAKVHHLRDRRFWYAAAIIVPLFQSGGHFYKYFGLVDQSITYNSFYALPISLLLLFFKPYYSLLNDRQQNIKVIPLIGLYLLAIILPFSGPLITGVVLVAATLLGTKIGLDLWKKGRSALLEIATFRNSFPLILLVLLCLYSLYLGRYNAEQDSNAVSILERYSRLPLGLYYLFSQKLAYPILFLMIALNFFLLKKYQLEKAQLYSIMKWLGFFALLYLLLLPLGGYRWYRPNLLRKDTFLPVALAIAFIYAYSSYLIVQNKDFHYRRIYLSLLLIMAFIFTYADELDQKPYQCQKAALIEIAESPQEVIKLKEDCTILTWYPVPEPAQSKRIMEQLKDWNIVKEDKTFYQVQE